MIGKTGVVEKRLQKKAKNALHGLLGRRDPNVDDIFEAVSYRSE